MCHQSKLTWDFYSFFLISFTTVKKVITITVCLIDWNFTKSCTRCKALVQFWSEKNTLISFYTYWQFLPFYAILRSIPDKLGGVAAMGGALIVLFLIPFTNTSEIRSTTFRPIFKIFYWLLVADFLLLGWIGQKPVKDIYVVVGQAATVFYFLFFVVLIPVIGTFESQLVKKVD